jgi:hypothetical protein
MISEKQRATILQRLEDGLSLRKACVEADVIRPAAVLDIARSDPVFGEQYARAREAGYQARADRLTDDSWNMSIPADHKRIIIDTQKWELSKMLPKVYGDRLNLEHSGSVSTQTLTRAELMAIAAQGKTQGGDA